MNTLQVDAAMGAHVPSRALWSRGLVAVLSAQFLSAMADNALLFGALALLRHEHYAPWTVPLLQEFFVGAYIVLAPFVGPFADAHSKGRVMLWANCVKLSGSLGMCLGLNPFLMYGLVGAGAAAYSPATAPIRMAAMVEPSIKPFALTKFSAAVSSERMPYLAGE
jgi:LPLT family lysophospholipid transporter-like MFS transporter